MESVESCLLFGIWSAPDNSNLVGKLKKVRVIESFKQKTENEKISKWIKRECKYHAHLMLLFTRGRKRYGLIFCRKNKETKFNIHGRPLNLNWSDIKVKTKT